MSLGKAGEDFAVKFLSQKGYKILTRNWRTPQGEIDILAYDPKEKYFLAVEVKTRQSFHFNEGFFSITPQKLQRIEQALLQYFEAQKLSPTPEYEIWGLILQATSKKGWLKKGWDFSVKYFDIIW